MAFTTKYKPLAEVKVLHNYFLNDGDALFSQMPQERQNKQLKLYDMSEVIEVVPSRLTLTKMAGYKMVFKKYKNGFFIYCKVSSNSQSAPFVPLPVTLQLTFLIRIKDAYFSNYTKYNGAPKDIYYFGNSKPDTEGNNFETIAKSTENKLVSEANKLSPAGATELLDTLNDDQGLNIFGVISLNVLGDTDELSLTALGDLKNPAPTFKIHFDNRKTFWRYIKSSDNSEIFTTAQPQPLTKYGFVEVTHNGDLYPNPGANHLIPDNNNFFSRIYI